MRGRVPPPLLLLLPLQAWKGGSWICMFGSDADYVTDAEHVRLAVLPI
jgi:hypothetical protein